MQNTKIIIVTLVVFHFLKFVMLNLLFSMYRLLRQSVASPISPHSMTWLQCFLSIHELGMFPVLTSTELEFSPAAKNYQVSNLK